MSYASLMVNASLLIRGMHNVRSTNLCLVLKGLCFLGLEGGEHDCKRLLRLFFSISARGGFIIWQPTSRETLS